MQEIKYEQLLALIVTPETRSALAHFWNDRLNPTGAYEKEPRWLDDSVLIVSLLENGRYGVVLLESYTAYEQLFVENMELLPGIYAISRRI